MDRTNFAFYLEEITCLAQNYVALVMSFLDLNEGIIFLPRFLRDQQLKEGLMAETLSLKGIPAAPGLASGPVFKLQKDIIKIPHHQIDDPISEKQRLKEARAVSINELGKLKETVSAQGKEKEAGIFDAHIMFLDDDSLVSLAEGEIDVGKNAEAAWMDAVEMIAQQLESIPDPNALRPSR